MKTLIVLGVMLSTQLVYGYESVQHDQVSHDQEQSLIATQYGWGDDPSVTVIRAMEAYLIPSQSDQILVILDADNRVYAHLLSEVRIQNLSYTTAIHADDVVYDLLDVEEVVGLDGGSF